jgi:hypothetical protein
MGDDQGIIFTASVFKVQTLSDGGIRVTLDLAENATLQAAHLMVCQSQGIALEATLKPVEMKVQPENGGNRTISRTKAKRRVG